MTENIFCQACRIAGSSSKMSIYQLNMEEAILMCENTQCVFTMVLGAARLQDYIITRKAEDIFKLKSKGEKANQSIQPMRLDKVIHWENIDALCWLNSALSVLVHNSTIKHLISRIQTSDNSLLKSLVNQYTKAQYLSEVDMINAKKVLIDVRDLVWTFLCPKMKCRLGVNDSPLFALLLLLEENVITADRCIQEYMCEFTCQSCQHTETTRHKKHVVTFPNTPLNFVLQEASFERPCNKCNDESQCTNIIHTRVPDVLFFHFVEGLKSSEYLNYRFNHEGFSYHVTQFIQYKHDPDHFICWTKHNDGVRWLDLDDLKPPLHCWSDSPPDVPPSQIHIIVLERVSSPCNTSSGDQQFSKSQSNVAGISKVDSSSQENQLNNATKQDIENELDAKLMISSQETPSKDNLIDNYSNRFPFKDLNNPNRTPQVVNCHSERPSSQSRALNSTIPYRVKLKRLPSGRQLQTFLAKNPKVLLNEFQPYVPKKERSCLPEESCIEGKTNCGNLHSPSCGLNSPTDSGYSSPSSVSSCSSNVIISKEESIADELEKLLPDCLENAAPIKEMSSQQDDFIQQLLNS